MAKWQQSGSSRSLSKSPWGPSAAGHCTLVSRASCGIRSIVFCPCSVTGHGTSNQTPHPGRGAKAAGMGIGGVIQNGGAEQLCESSAGKVSPEGGVVMGGDPRGWQREHALKPEFAQVVFILRSIHRPCGLGEQHISLSIIFFLGKMKIATYTVFTSRGWVWWLILCL